MNNNGWYSDRGMPHMISTRDSFVVNSENKSNSKNKLSESLLNGYMTGLMLGISVGLIFGIMIFG